MIFAVVWAALVLLGWSWCVAAGDEDNRSVERFNRQQEAFRRNGR
jgi:hypothetical protein